MKRSLFMVVCLCLLLLPLNGGEAAFANTGAGSVQAFGVPS